MAREKVEGWVWGNQIWGYNAIGLKGLACFVLGFWGFITPYPKTLNSKPYDVLLGLLGLSRSRLLGGLLC